MYFIENIKIQGFHVHTVLKFLHQNHIRVKKIKQEENTLTFSYDIKDRKKVNEILLDKGYKTLEVKQEGMYFAYVFLESRLYLIVLFLILSGALAHMMTRYLYVDIINAGEYLHYTQEILKEEGIVPLIKKSDVDRNKVRTLLEWSFPAVTWVHVEEKGQDLCISFKRGAYKGNAPVIQGNQDVVSNINGIVDKVLVYAGTAHVKKGDVIKKGDVLIKGMEKKDMESMHPVIARGKIICKTYQQASVYVPIKEIQSLETGRIQKNRQIQTPYCMFGENSLPLFQHYDEQIQKTPIGSVFFPFFLIEKTYIEVQLKENTRDIENIKKEACASALIKLKKSLSFSDVVIDKWVDYSMIEGEKILATVSAEILTTIGDK